MKRLKIFGLLAAIVLLAFGLALGCDSSTPEPDAGPRADVARFVSEDGQIEFLFSSDANELSRAADGKPQSGDHYVIRWISTRRVISEGTVNVGASGITFNPATSSGQAPFTAELSSAGDGLTVLGMPNPDTGGTFGTISGGKEGSNYQPPSTGPGGSSGGSQGPSFIAVTDIIGEFYPYFYLAPGESADLELAGGVRPENATNKTIVWSVVSAGAGVTAVIDEDILTVEAGDSGLNTNGVLVVVRATIARGTSSSTAYTKDFDVTVYPDTSLRAPVITTPGSTYVQNETVLTAELAPNNDGVIYYNTTGATITDTGGNIELSSGHAVGSETGTIKFAVATLRIYNGQVIEYSPTEKRDFTWAIAATPTLTVDGEDKLTYTRNTSKFELATDTEDAVILYSIDGTPPAGNYFDDEDDGILIPGDTTLVVKAKATATGYQDSEVAEWTLVVEGVEPWTVTTSANGADISSWGSVDRDVNTEITQANSAGNTRFTYNTSTGAVTFSQAQLAVWDRGADSPIPGESNYNALVRYALVEGKEWGTDFDEVRITISGVLNEAQLYVEGLESQLKFDSTFIGVVGSDTLFKVPLNFAVKDSTLWEAMDPDRSGKDILYFFYNDGSLVGTASGGKFPTITILNGTPAFNVTFVTNGGSAVPAKAVAQGSKVSLPSSTRAGYVLGGWYKTDPYTDGSAEEWDFSTGEVEEDTTLYAGWKFAPGSVKMLYTQAEVENGVAALGIYADRTIGGQSTSVTLWKQGAQIGPTANGSGINLATAMTAESGIDKVVGDFIRMLREETSNRNNVNFARYFVVDKVIKGQSGETLTTYDFDTIKISAGSFITNGTANSSATSWTNGTVFHITSSGTPIGTLSAVGVGFANSPNKEEDGTAQSVNPIDVRKAGGAITWEFYKGDYVVFTLDGDWFPAVSGSYTF